MVFPGSGGVQLALVLENILAAPDLTLEVIANP